MKAHYKEQKPKIVQYRNQKNFSKDSFDED